LPLHHHDHKLVSCGVSPFHLNPLRGEVLETSPPPWDPARGGTRVERQPATALIVEGSIGADPARVCAGPSDCLLSGLLEALLCNPVCNLALLTPPRPSKQGFEQQEPRQRGRKVT